MIDVYKVNKEIVLRGFAIVDLPSYYIFLVKLSRLKEEKADEVITQICEIRKEFNIPAKFNVIKLKLE